MFKFDDATYQNIRVFENAKRHLLDFASVHRQITDNSINHECKTLQEAIKFHTPKVVNGVNGVAARKQERLQSAKWGDLQVFDIPRCYDFVSDITVTGEARTVHVLIGEQIIETGTSDETLATECIPAYALPYARLAILVSGADNATVTFRGSMCHTQDIPYTDLYSDHYRYVITGGTNVINYTIPDTVETAQQLLVRSRKVDTFTHTEVKRVVIGSTLTPSYFAFTDFVIESSEPVKLASCGFVYNPDFKTGTVIQSIYRNEITLESDKEFTVTYDVYELPAPGDKFAYLPALRMFMSPDRTHFYTKPCADIAELNIFINRPIKTMKNNNSE